LANFRILGVKKLLGTYQFLMRYALASADHPLPTAKFLGERTLAPEIWASAKVDFEWVEKRSHFRRLWTKAHQVW